jgi:V/A-type H+-transporting ATPase subunit E
MKELKSTMGVQLQELLEKIKQDGVQSAEEESQRIIAETEKKAGEMIAEAEQKASQIVDNAKKEASRLKQSGNEALQQAGRDLLLEIERDIKAVFSRLIEKETGTALKENALETAIVDLIKAWPENNVSDIQVLLKKEDLNKIETGLRQKLKSEFAEGLELSAFEGIDGGFRISEKDGSAYYDFTKSGIAEALSQYLNPRLGDIIKQSVE